MRASLGYISRIRFATTPFYVLISREGASISLGIHLTLDFGGAQCSSVEIT